MLTSTTRNIALDVALFIGGLITVAVLWFKPFGTTHTITGQVLSVHCSFGRHTRLHLGVKATDGRRYEFEVSSPNHCTRVAGVVPRRTADFVTGAPVQVVAKSWSATDTCGSSPARPPLGFSVSLNACTYQDVRRVFVNGRKVI